MGSLMAGWDSPTTDPQEVSHRRNKSLTKEEIEAFWKTKKQVHEEHLRAILSPFETLEEKEKENLGNNLQRSASMPPFNTRKGLLENVKSETNLEKPEKNPWWRRSNWAFLNEPPETEGSGNSYVSQFHVANMAASRLGRGGVSA